MAAKKNSHEPLRAVSIRPGVSVLSLLKHLNYRPWFAISEFVDNSIQSYNSNQDSLKKAEGNQSKLLVDIDFDPAAGRLCIRDNAAGIKAADFPRAFRPAEVPLDRSGLSEFGIGMKSAACWFAKKWIVRTKALGEPIERTVRFDIDRIVHDNLDELKIAESPATKHSHYTEIVLEDLHHPPHHKTVSKMKEHLAGIYRVFTRGGQMRLRFGEDTLEYEEPDILDAPHYKTPNAKPRSWRKDIKFDLGKGMHVHGFAGIRATASTSAAGFALFRRNRLIQGSADEAYRPEMIFGKGNSYRSQRIFGELHLDGFDVSHTKDGFRWDENEEPFLSLLREHLDHKDLPLLDQAEGFRVRPKAVDIRPAADEAAKNTVSALEKNAGPIITDQIEAEGGSDSREPALTSAAEKISNRQFELEIGDVRWLVTLELTSDPGIGEWLSVGDTGVEGKKKKRTLQLRVSLAHPFMTRFAGTDRERIEGLIRIATAFGLAEVSADEAGGGPTSVRRNVNELLRDVLSKA